MGCSTRLGLARMEKARKMLRDGFTDTEIAGALKIRKNVISDFRKTEGVKNARKTIENKQTAGKLGRGRDPGKTKNQEDQQRDSDQLDDNGSHGAGESIGEPTTGITFVGGNTMVKGEKDSSEELDWECAECGHEFNGKPARCPKCDTELEYD